MNEKLKGISKKVFTKKKITGAIVVLAIVVGLKLGYSLIYDIHGTVTKVDANSITVSNFITTTTINTGDYTIDTSKIVVGERVEVQKNISGKVINVSGGRGDHGTGGKGGIRDGGMKGGKGLSGSGETQQQKPTNQ